jgi:hypothetical protein
MRYFDGTRWTDLPPPPPHTLTPQPYAERRFTVHYGFALLAGFSLLGTLVIGIPMVAGASSSSDQGAAGIGFGMALLWFLWGGMWTVIWTAFAIQHTLRGRRR